MDCGERYDNRTKTYTEKYCDKNYPYCNDSGFCGKKKTEQNTGMNSKYDYQEISLMYQILFILCCLICCFIIFKITYRLYQGCADGDMMSCFILFR